MARVGIDIDGVVADFHAAFIAYAIRNNWIGEEHRDHEPQCWEFYLDLGLTKSDYAQIMKDGANEIFRTCNPIAGAASVVQQLIKEGHEIIFVTNRYSSAEEVTREWLTLHHFPFDELHHTSDKTKIELDFFIDDKPENVEDLNAAGVCAYLMDADWNYDASYQPDRVYSLVQYRMRVQLICNLGPAALAQEHPRTARIKRFLAGAEKVAASQVGEPEEACDCPEREGVDDAYELGLGKLTEMGEELKARYNLVAGEVRTVSASGGEKGTKLACYSQIPPNALNELAEHFGRGARKYEAHNFRRGYEWSKSFDALNRHLNAFWGGEDLDEETGSKHIIAVAWHALTLATFMDEHPDYDDRYKGATK